MRSRSTRQDHFVSKFGFTCQCSICSGPLDPASDARRERIAAIDGQVLQACNLLDAVLAVRLNKERLRLRDKEGLHDCYGRADDHNMLFHMMLRAGDPAAARRHISQAYAFSVLCYGADSAEAEKYRQRKAGISNVGFVESLIWKMANALPAICDACGKEEVGGFKGKAAKQDIVGSVIALSTAQRVAKQLTEDIIRRFAMS
jgi:hypothetical protein